MQMRSKMETNTAENTDEISSKTQMRTEVKWRKNKSKVIQTRTGVKYRQEQE